MTIEGIPNQLFSNGILRTDIYDECERFLSGMYKEERSIDNTVKKLSLSWVDPIEFFDKKYSVWLDFKSTQDNFLNGSGRKIVSVSEGISLKIDREADTRTRFSRTIYAFMSMDGLLQIVDQKVERVVVFTCWKEISRNKLAEKNKRNKIILYKKTLVVDQIINL